MTIFQSVSAALTLTTLAVSACGTPPPTVELTMHVERDGARVQLEGTTDLTDGAILAYELRHEQVDHDPETPRDMLFREGRMTVSNGRYAAEIDISSFEPGEIEVWVAFQMDFINSDLTQPGGILRQFGERGELLEGGNVTDLGEDGKRVELTDAIHW